MAEATISPAELEQLADMIANRIAAELARQPLLISKEELSERTTMSLSTIERRVKDGTIPAIRMGRRLLFDPAVVLRKLEKDTSKGADQQ